jgi:hypothetical protein
MALTRITSDGITDGTITGTDLATNIDLVDNQKLRLGTGNDLQIYHDGNSRIVNTTNYLTIKSDQFALQNQAGDHDYITVPTANQNVRLHYDNVVKFQTQSWGCEVTGQLHATGSVKVEDNAEIQIGTSADLKIYHDGSHSRLVDAGTGYIKIQSSQIALLNADDSAQIAQFYAGGAVELYHDNSKKFETDASGINVTGDIDVTGKVAILDNQKLICGVGDDLQIYHDGNNSFIDNTGIGNLNLYGDDINILNKAKTEFKAKFITDGAVELYYNNSKKTQTTTWGFQIIGDLLPQGDNSRKLGESNERWSIVYAANGSINTSDKTEKNTIVESDLGLDFVNKLKPISFKWNKDDGKTHYGLIAQDLEETILSLGKSITDFGGISKEEDSPMGLGYCELISPLIKAIQELSAEVAALKAG